MNYNDIKNLKDPEGWQKTQDANQDSYGGACVKIAYFVMKALDDPEIKVEDPSNMITGADRLIGEGITGFMAGAAASIISQIHERGDEFRKAGNLKQQIGTEGEEANEEGGILNPALMSIGK